MSNPDTQLFPHLREIKSNLQRELQNTNADRQNVQSVLLQINRLSVEEVDQEIRKIRTLIAVLKDEFGVREEGKN